MATSAASQPEPSLGTFSALRQREFALLWYGSLGQSIGLGMQQIALGYFVWDRTESELWVGAVAFMVLHGVWLGLLMKHFHREQLAPIVRLADGGMARNWPASLGALFGLVVFAPNLVDVAWGTVAAARIVVR